MEREHGQAERALLVVSTDVQGGAVDPQLTAVLQWIAASIADLSLMQLSHFSDQELQQVRTLRLFSHCQFKLLLFSLTKSMTKKKC